MYIRSLLSPLAIVFGLGVVAAAPAPEPAEKPDAAKIAKLIAQLGGRDFDDREKASAALDAIGEPALDALREAVKSTDAEVRKRAETLIDKIQKRLEPEITRRPKRVHLLFKETPLKDAVEAFRKQSGYDLVLHIPDDKLKGRAVTLDTGDVTYWQAFGSFCEKAGLKEAEVRDLVSVRPPYFTAGVGPMIAVDRITLLDGQPAAGPTDSITAVRVQALIPPVAEAKTDRLRVALLLSLEPKLQWLSVEKVTIAKAVDDQKQELDPTATDVTPANPKQMPPVITAAADEFIGGGIYREAVIHLKKGPKASRSLTEFSGTISAKILGEMSAIITVPDILTAGGKTFKGGEDGQIKVLDVLKKDNGQVLIRLEMHAPSGVVALDGCGVPVGVAKGVAAVPDGRFMGPGLGYGCNNDNGLGLMDDKGNNIKVVPGGRLEASDKATPFGVVGRVVHTEVFQLEKGQKASEMVFSGRKILSVEIPFTLKDVPLP